MIGTVSSPEKATQAREDGCHHTIIYKEEDFVSRVNEITSGNGVDVVYDSVGKDTFQVIVEGKCWGMNLLLISCDWYFLLYCSTLAFL